MSELENYLRDMRLSYREFAYLVGQVTGVSVSTLDVINLVDPDDTTLYDRATLQAICETLMKHSYQPYARLIEINDIGLSQKILQ